MGDRRLAFFLDTEIQNEFGFSELLARTVEKLIKSCINDGYKNYHSIAELVVDVLTSSSYYRNNPDIAEDLLQKEIGYDRDLDKELKKFQEKLSTLIAAWLNCGKDPMLSLREFIDQRYNGNQSSFGRANGVQRAQVTQWLKGDYFVEHGKLFSVRRNLA